jgi:autotransporter-associated beta strand protein
MKTKLLILLALSLAIAFDAEAGSATWNSNPVSGDWNDPANWTPNTVPDGPDDVATFGSSSITTVYISSFIELDSLVIDPGASAFTFNTLSGSLLTFSGTGIANNSGLVQNFTTEDPGNGNGAFQFNGSSTAGTDTFFTNTGITNFDENGSAGDATINCVGGSSYFYGGSTAANATIIINGFGLVSLGSGTAANATLIATGGSIGLGFIGTAGPNTARVQLYDKGNLLVNAGSIGSLEGNGLVIIEPFANLSIGSNNLSTTFSGEIKGDTPFSNPLGKGGAITKEGTGTLTLSGHCTYKNGTTVNAGTLVVANQRGSATGNALVNVTGGTLAGSGIIAGNVEVGMSTGVQGFLAPSEGMQKPATLTILKSLALSGYSTYLCKLNTNRAVSDEVIANGVTIDAGAMFSLGPQGNDALTLGQVFTVISNTARTPIAGAFDNLAEGEILTVNGSNLQASYTGGDGNDLTLTVVP